MDEIRTSGGPSPEASAFERQMATVLEEMGEPEPRFDAMSIVRIATAERRRPRSETWFGTLRIAVAGLLVGIVGTGAIAIILQSDAGVTPGVSPSPSPTASATVTDVIEIGGGTGVRALVPAGDSMWAAVGVRVVRIDPTTRSVDAAAELTSDVSILIPTADAIWAANARTAWRIDRATNEVMPVDLIGIIDEKLDGATFDDQKMEAPIIAGGSLWVQLDAVDRRVLAEVDLEARTPTIYELPGGFSAWWSQEMDGAIWSYHPNGAISTFDLASKRFVGDAIVVAFRPSRTCCLVHDGSIWLFGGRSVVRVDLASRGVGDPIEVDPGISMGIVEAGSMWIPDRDDGAVRKLDLGTLEVTDVIPVGGDPARPVVFDGAIWVASAGSRTVSRIAVGSAAVEQVITIEGGAGQPIVFDDALWVPATDGSSVSRIATPVDR